MNDKLTLEKTIRAVRVHKPSKNQKKALTRNNHNVSMIKQTVNQTHTQKRQQCRVLGTDNIRKETQDEEGKAG